MANNSIPTESAGPSSDRLHVSSHPLVRSKITQLRLHDLPAKDFRELVKAVG
jgi:uracil phosphoribosyltransferase